MKKSVLLILCVMLLGFSAVSAHADIIYEPYTEFTQSHHCTSSYFWYRYMVSGDKPVTVYVSPEDLREVLTLEPGEIISVNTTYEDGDVTWYFYEISPNAGKVSGWIRGTDLERIYDSDLFFEDHKSEIHASVTLDITDLTDLACCYYPGGQFMRNLTGEVELEKNNSPDKATLDFLQSWTDEDGNVWGYLSYFYGGVNGWVCLSDPLLEHVEVSKEPVLLRDVRKDVPEETETPDETSSEEKDETPAETSAEPSQEPSTENGEIPPEKNIRPLLIILPAALLAVLISGLLLFFLMKKKKKG